MSPAATSLFRADAVRQLESDACRALGGDAGVLMQRAGQAAWRCLLQHWPQAQRIGVVCGPGNNGGDGYVLARHALQSGRAVQVLRLRAHAPRTPLARQVELAYRAAGGECVDVDAAVLPQVDLLVDALFGIGLDRAPDAATAAVITAINTATAPVLALDVPSGVDSSSGHVPGVAVRATRTLQFLGQHIGLRTGAGLDHVGALQWATLDAAPELFSTIPAAARLLDTQHPPAAWPARLRNSHKGRHGHVLCVGGDAGMGGAALLCSQAALRGGAGLVSLASQAMTVQASLARAPECMARVVDSADELQPLLARADVLAVGPGLGQSTWARALFEACVVAGKPLVVDADALTVLPQNPMPTADAVLTPHPGEAARLLDCDVAGIQRDRLLAAQRLADRFAATVVLKGAGSVIASPGEIPCVLDVGNPGMAVGGMGDVLTGIIAALRAQGLTAFDAACTGAWLHAATADQVAAERGMIGMLPSDVIDALPHLLHRHATVASSS